MTWSWFFCCRLFACCGWRRTLCNNYLGRWRRIVIVCFLISYVIIAIGKLHQRRACAGGPTCLINTIFHRRCQIGNLTIIFSINCFCCRCIPICLLDGEVFHNLSMQTIFSVDRDTRCSCIFVIGISQCIACSCPKYYPLPLFVSSSLSLFD